MKGPGPKALLSMATRTIKKDNIFKVFIRKDLFKVPHSYTKDATGQLEHDQYLFHELIK